MGNAQATAEAARGEGAALRLRAEAEAAALRLRAEAEAMALRAKGEAEGDSIRAVGATKADTYQRGQASLGQVTYAALQMAAILGEHQVKLVPDIAVGGEGSTRLADVMMGRMLLGTVRSDSDTGGSTREGH